MPVLHSKRNVAVVIGLFAVLAVLAWFGTETRELRQEVQRLNEIVDYIVTSQFEMAAEIDERLVGIDDRLNAGTESRIELHIADLRVAQQLEELELELQRFMSRFR